MLAVAVGVAVLAVVVALAAAARLPHPWRLLVPHGADWRELQDPAPIAPQLLLAPHTNIETIAIRCYDARVHKGGLRATIGVFEAPSGVSSQEWVAVRLLSDPVEVPSSSTMRRALRDQSTNALDCASCALLVWRVDVRAVHRVLYSAFVAVAGASCAAQQIPHHVLQRDFEVVQSVELTGLPNDSRITLEDARNPSERNVLANHVTGSITLSFTYTAHEDVDNGAATRVTTPATYIIVAHAPGYLPRTLELMIPGPQRVSAKLERPRLFAIDIDRDMEPNLDAAFERTLSGRCQEAGAYLARTNLGRLSQGCRPVELLGTNTTGPDPTGLGIPAALEESPLAALHALKILMAHEKDRVGAEALDRIVVDVDEGRLNEAARIAALVAAPLPARRAALVLQLPTALLALDRLREATELVAQHDTRAAMELAAEASSIDSRIGQRERNEIGCGSFMTSLDDNKFDHLTS